MKLKRAISFVASMLGVTGALFAGFGSTESFLPAVGRVPGQGGAQFYTTVWVTNLTSAPQTFTFRFLKQGQANTSPSSFLDSLAPGETKVYENVVESKLGLANALGAARVTSSGEIFVSERIYNQAPGNDLGNSEGLFFAGVPKAFSISAGQSASIQGINQGGSEDFRYNFALIETGGGSPTVNVQAFDASGTLMGQKAYPLLPYEQVQPNVADVVPGIHTTNARITATVADGTGSVLMAGAQLANASQDSSGFEMTFRDALLATGSGAAGVTSLDGLTGALTLKAGANITITPAGSQITIAAAGGAVGLALPFAGAGSVSGLGAVLGIANTGSGGFAIAGSGGNGFAGVAGTSLNGAGVSGTTEDSSFFTAFSSHGAGIFGGSGAGDGVEGNSDSGVGVSGDSNSSWGVYGKSVGTGLNGAAVRAEGLGIGLFATNNSADSTLVLGNSDLAGDVIRAFTGPGGGTFAFQVTAAGDVKAHGSFTPNGIDYADRLPATAGLEPGDVVTIGQGGFLEKSARPNDPAVAGVYSTRPGVVGREEAETRTTIPVALAGVIPVKATAINGTIRPGDLLVSSSISGRAMRSAPAPAPGTVLGKAMGSLERGDGMVEMLVMLR